MCQKLLWNSNEIFHEKPISLKFSLENVKDVPWTWWWIVPFSVNFKTILAPLGIFEIFKHKQI